MPPVRSCIACRRRASPAELLRLVVDAHGVVQPDPEARRPGRGAWIHPEQACLSRLLRRPRQLDRALRSRCVVEGLEQRLLSCSLHRIQRELPLAARSGLVASGAQRLAAASGELVVLVVAEDASERSVASLTALANELPAFRIPLGRSALGALVGKGPRAALGVRRGARGEALLSELRRYSSLGYHPPRNRSGDRPEATRRPGTPQSRGRGLGSPSSPVSSRSKSGEPPGPRLREGSVCPRKRS